MQRQSVSAQQQAAMTAAAPFAHRMAGAVDMFISLQGLEGHWDLSPDLKSIVRTDAQPNIAQKQNRKRK
jgi:hypothetical protein